MFHCAEIRMDAGCWMTDAGCWVLSISDGLNQAVSQVSQKAAMAAQPLYVSCYTLTEEWLRELRMPDTKQRGSQHIRTRGTGIPCNR